MARRKAVGVAVVLALLAVAVVVGAYLRSARGAYDGQAAAGTLGASVLRNPDSTVYTAADGILFDLDSAALDPSAVPALEAIVADIRKSRLTGTIRVEGHTDDLGSEEYNLSLSRVRAEAVAAWLVQEGHVDQARIEVDGLGESDPVQPNDSDEHRRANRRVVIAVMRGPAASGTGTPTG